jgi:hypothetical protein
VGKNLPKRRTGKPIAVSGESIRLGRREEVLLRSQTVVIGALSVIVLLVTVNREIALISHAMDAFPEFMKHPANRIARSNQSTPGVEGYVFDGANGSQMAFWTCNETATSMEHVHDYDEYYGGCAGLLHVGHSRGTDCAEGRRRILNPVRCAA